MRRLVSSHAISRYRERVDPVSYDEAHRRLSSPRIRLMIAFGAREIILGRGHHAVVEDGIIVTVRPKERRRKKHRPGDAEQHEPS